MDSVREAERLWNCMLFKPSTCALPCWTIASPMSVSLQLSFHSLLLFVLSLCQKSSWCSPLKLFLSLTRTVPSSLLTCPASLAQSRFCPRLHSACFWKQFSSPPYSFTLARPVGKPPSSRSLSILMVSKRPRGISDSLTDCPRLHLKPGSISPVHFGNSHPISTFANFALIL